MSASEKEPTLPERPGWAQSRRRYGGGKDRFGDQIFSSGTTRLVSAVVHCVCTKNAPEPTLHARVASGSGPQYGAGNDAFGSATVRARSKDPSCNCFAIGYKCDMACGRNPNPAISQQRWQINEMRPIGQELPAPCNLPQVSSDITRQR